MHMKDIIVHSPRKPRELLDKGQTLNMRKFANIPFDEFAFRKKDDIDDESDSDNEGKYYNYSEKDNELILQLRKLRLSSDTKDESDEEETPADDQVVAKGLQDNKELRRGKRAESVRPYPVVQNVLCNWLDSRNGQAEMLNYDPNDMVNNISLPAVEHGAPSVVGPTILEENTPGMQDFETSLIDFKFDVDDFLSIQKAIEANEQSSYITLESSLPNTSTSTDVTNEYCESTRDSGYATSPTNSNQSVHSPQSSVYSRQSPDPRGIPKYDNRLPSYFSEFENDLKTRPEYHNQSEVYNYHSNPVPQMQPPKDGYHHVRCFSNSYQPIPDPVHKALNLPQAPVCSISVDLTDMPARTQMPFLQRPNVTKPIQLNHYQQPMPDTPKDKKPNKSSNPPKYLQPTTEVPVYENEYIKPASERIGKLMKRNKVETLNITVSCESTEVFCNIKENQTKIMQLLLIKDTPQDFIERVYVRLQRLKRNKHVSLLKHRDAENRNALFIAATVHKTRPIIARFIADVYSHLETSPDESYANDNSLLHILAGEGDDCANVMAELLHSTMPEKAKCFNVNSTNKDMLTPLHIATRAHDPPTKFTYGICRLLINHGANLTIHDNEGNTPLHIAIKKHCDPVYIKALLNSSTARQCVNMTDNDNNTPLHLAAKRNDIPLEKQKEVIKHLISSLAQYDIQNRDGKIALALVSFERKEEIRKIFQNRI